MKRISEALVSDAADVPAETEHDEAADVERKRLVREIEASGGDGGEQGGDPQWSGDLPPDVHRARGDGEHPAHAAQQRGLACAFSLLGGGDHRVLHAARALHSSWLSSAPL